MRDNINCGMRYKRMRKGWLVVLIAYILTLYYFAVLGRNTSANSYIRLELFWGYFSQNEKLIMDNLINIVCFIPIGMLAGMTNTKRKVAMALFIGLMLSLAIECSQYYWKRGVFDVDDLFNNSLGAVIGCLIVTLLGKCVKVLTSRWFFQSLRLMKAAEPSGKRPEVERTIHNS